MFTFVNFLTLDHGRAVKDLHCGHLLYVFLSTSAADFFDYQDKSLYCCCVPFSVPTSINSGSKIISLFQAKMD